MKAHPGFLVRNATIGGCNQAQDAAVTLPPALKVGAERDDNVITARVESALLADPDVQSLFFKIEPHKGEVQLTARYIL